MAPARNIEVQITADTTRLELGLLRAEVTTLRTTNDLLRQRNAWLTSALAAAQRPVWKRLLRIGPVTGKEEEQ